MSIIDTRSALGNQDGLYAEYANYGANVVTPGLVGWEHINRRAELEIDVKARFNGEYVEKLSLGMDMKCFVETIFLVQRSEGVVEGVIVEMKKEDNNRSKV